MKFATNTELTEKWRACAGSRCRVKLMLAACDIDVLDACRVEFRTTWKIRNFRLEKMTIIHGIGGDWCNTVFSMHRKWQQPSDTTEKQHVIVHRERYRKYNYYSLPLPARALG
ncbi:hypothetical protein AVEN_112216-1 [Araneus ventricosus]|uniref:Uncharacterized protein n=1 Tax=Araneus ventricosus TaxID=182803 RepID=A0A4Y2V176_ARAVE|nr:hypothetical protein AVEN_112216-1 [Araneus ventricosus]